MSQEDRELLFKDLYARLPYNPMVEYKGETYNVLGIAHGRLVLCKPFMSYTLDENPLVKEVKPYLIPLSSITEDQKKELQSLMISDSYGILYHTLESFNYMCKNKIDFRGLIPKGLAIDLD